jgi:hypothetical protein
MAPSLNWDDGQRVAHGAVASAEPDTESSMFTCSIFRLYRELFLFPLGKHESINVVCFLYNWEILGAKR